jgi:hypothetical protein
MIKYFILGLIVFSLPFLVYLAYKIFDYFCEYVMEDDLNATF